MKQIKIVTEGEVNLLKERILQTLEKSRNIDQRKLAQIAHVNESSISRYLNGHDEINFEGVLRIVKYLYLEQEREIMSEYIRTQKSKNARYALEYCAMNHLWDLVEYLIGFLSESTNPVDKEWAAMYQLLLSRNEKILSPREQLNKIEVFKPKELEMQVLKSIFKAYIYHDLDELNALHLHVDGTDTLVKSIKSSFIQDSFNVRLSLILSQISLYSNDIELSRKYSLSIVNQRFFEDVKATAYYNLGLSYSLESYEKSVEYLNKALDFFIFRNNVGRIDQTRRLDSFIKTHWGVNFEFTHNLDNHRSFLNYIYYLIKKGELSLAGEHINKLDIKELTEWDKGFYYYYKGLLSNDKTSFYNSVESFINLDDYFHLQLPLIELQRLGENEVVLRLLSLRRRK